MSAEAKPSDQAAAAKREIRSKVAAARAVSAPTTREADAERIAHNVVSLLSDREVRTVCAYVSVTGEPGTGPLIDRLHSAGVHVLLPLLLDDLDLGWARYEPSGLRPGRFGLVEPTGPSLGVDAIQGAELVVCPGVAGTPDGARLGRGGGSYDRALARALPSTLICLLLYDDEVLADVPTEPHDRTVDVIVTPTQILRTSARRRG